MSSCTPLTENASQSVAAALRAVDCLASETTASAFGRLFSSGGVLLPALTGILTLYIAFFAISLLTGRSRIGISALTPRMMTLGLILTFTTSWVAYQSVVWTLAVGAPDQIAGVLMGTKGSATLIFADRVDLIFAAIAEVAESTSGGQAGATPAAAGSFTPGNLMWLGALLLLLGTVGVLVTARIALAVLLALGPVFILLGLFPGTRGLCAGWLRGMVMTAVTPLFVVLGGGLVLELLVPVVSTLRGETGVDGRAALALFLITAVHVALMTMILKVTSTIVSGWRVFGLGDTKAEPEVVVVHNDVPQQSAPQLEIQDSLHTSGGATSRRAAEIAKTVSLPPEMISLPQPANSNTPARDTVRSIEIANSVVSQSQSVHSRSRELGQQFRQAKNKPVESIR